MAGGGAGGRGRGRGEGLRLLLLTDDAGGHCSEFGSDSHSWYETHKGTGEGGRGGRGGGRRARDCKWGSVTTCTCNYTKYTIIHCTCSSYIVYLHVCTCT